MTINFVTIRKTRQSDYGVLHVMFPKEGTFEGASKVIQISPTKEEAENAAKEFAERVQYPFVPLNKNVITAASFYGSPLYFVTEVNWCGNSVCRGNLDTTDKETAREFAAKFAQEKDLALIFP